MPLLKPTGVQHILLADDDLDDCEFFKEALQELLIPARISIVHDGVQLMGFLDNNDQLPDIIFLDLNMPRKNGHTCLLEIKARERFRKLPVIILSTSFERANIKQLHKDGAYHYFRKPTE